MFTHKDISARTIFVLNCFDSERRFRVSGGELMLEQVEQDKHTTLTKFPFQKILALFVIGPISITTPLIDKCKKYGVALVVMKSNLRPVFVWADSAEANYLLRKRQFEYPADDIDIAKSLAHNKIFNQCRNLQKTRRKDRLTSDAVTYCVDALSTLEFVDTYDSLMGLEGAVAKSYFGAYFQDMQWHGRHPRVKCDTLNLTLDIGYTILFNFMECFLRMFGFDLYVGVYHRLWFKRKSLVCDLMEPFRCIIDHTVRSAFNRGQFRDSDFRMVKHAYQLKYERCPDYYRVFYDALIAYKSEFFVYVQQYYRCFMGCKSVRSYPKFEFK
ncbi:MAG: type V CRISPR-associated endonuclease Cas1 [Alistipes sp.]|nr:type V CRISPR-associated endonuclease Cas1 [Alistipes sp.]